MIDKIQVNIGLDHSFVCANNIIGRTGEGYVTEFEITVPAELSDWSLYLDFRKPNGETHRTQKLTLKNRVATYRIEPFILTDGGEIEAQAVLQKEGEVTWKSFIKIYTNVKSVNAVEDDYIKPNGQLNISVNGFYDVTLYASALVAVDDSSTVIPEGYIKPTNNKHITENGTGIDVAQYATVSVSVPQGENAELMTKGITANGKYIASQDGADGYSIVTVDVPTKEPEVKTKSITANGKYIASDEKLDGYSIVTVNVPQGEETELTTKSITANGVYNASKDGVDGYSTVTVDVPTKEPKLKTKSITANGKYTASTESVDGYSIVTVDVPTGITPTETLTITSENLGDYDTGEKIDVSNVKYLIIKLDTFTDEW